MKHYIPLLLIFTTIAAAAQNQCGFENIYSSSFQNEEEYILEQKETHRHIAEAIESGAAFRGDGVDTFDIVFHIVHLGEPIGEGANISDAQIESAVFSLNRDFRALPIHDSISISPYGIDSEIQFRLACTDPDGNPSNGINRVDGRAVPGYEEEGFHFQSGNTGNNNDLIELSKWPYDRYINIWITHRIETPNGQVVGGGGFGPNNTFLFNQGIGGLYLFYKVVGSDVDGSQGYDIINPYGKVISHEMGHFFGLLHTFQNGSCTETNCMVEGDGVCDTEPHDNSVPNDANCDEYIECGTREPIENLMNYSGQTCGNIFTPGQKNRMKTTIEMFLQDMANLEYCSPVTASNEPINKMGFNIYPNPANDRIYVENTKNPTLIITGINGKVMVYEPNYDGVSAIDISYFPNGLYFIKLKNEIEIQNKKIIVSH